MRFLLLFIAILLFSCNRDDPFAGGKDDIDFPPRRETITFPCNKFNGSVEWEECTPVVLDLSAPKYRNLASATMTYVLVTTRGNSHMIAELYNKTTGRSIVLSEVISRVEDSIDSRPKTVDILDQLPLERSELVIRFRNSEDGPQGYINNYSFLTLTYKQ
ncbi:MAG: hypothetical protein JXR03_00950 [Cyclobacteriaceae bacterium]